MSSDPSIYPSLPEYTPYSTNLYVRPSQNLPLPPRIYSPLKTTRILCDAPRIYPISPKYTPPPPPSTTICSTLRIYPFLPEYTPPPFSTTMLLCDAPRINPFLPEYTPFQQLNATLPETTHPSENTPPFLELYEPPPSQNISLLPFLKQYAISK